MYEDMFDMKIFNSDSATLLYCWSLSGYLIMPRSGSTSGSCYVWKNSSSINSTFHYKIDQLYLYACVSSVMESGPVWFPQVSKHVFFKLFLSRIRIRHSVQAWHWRNGRWRISIIWLRSSNLKIIVFLQDFYQKDLKRMYGARCA